MMKTMSEERAAFEDYCREIGYTLNVCDSGRYLGGYGAELWAGFKTGAAWQRAQSAGVPLVMAADYAALEAECDALRQQRDKLAKVLEDVEREHDLIRRMKNCEIHRGRGSFGIAVMSDPPALEWQALDKELQQLIDARRDAMGVKLAAIKGQEEEE